MRGLESNFEAVRVPAGWLSRQANVQTVSLHVEDYQGRRSQQRRGGNLAPVKLRSSEGVNHRFAAAGPPQFTHIQGVVFCREAKIALGKELRFRVVKGAFNDLGRAFAVDFPGARAVYSFAVYLQPRTNFTKNALHFVWDRAVRARANVDEQVSVFADDVDKLMKDRLRRFKTVVLDEAPGFVADGSIGLPVERANVVQLAALNIENGRVFFHGIQFVVDDSH